jgi:hypothetical protein
MNPLIDKLPPWYRGDILHQARVLSISIRELSGHGLDEVIDEKLTNHKFQWPSE